MRLTVGTKVGASILLLGASFTIGGVVVLHSVSEVRRMAALIKERDVAVQYGLTMASCVRDQYIHEAHLIITRDMAHVNHFDDVVRKTKECQFQVRKRLTEDDERATMDEIDSCAEKFRDIFYTGVVKAVEDANTAKALDLHERSDQLVERIIHLTGLLFESLNRKNKEAQDLATTYSKRARSVTIACSLSGLLLAIGAFFYVQRVLSPIPQLRAATRRVARGQFDTRIPERGGDELADLARQFNWMAGKLQAHHRSIVEAERSAAMGHVAAGIAHQINNPIAVILGYTKAASDPTYSDKLDPKQILKVIEEEARECQDIVESLLGLVRPVTVARVQFDLRSLIEDVGERALRYANGQGIRKEVILDPPDLQLNTDRNKLRQILMNLLVNAMESMPDGGLVKVLGKLTASPSGKRLQITVSDQGRGMSAEEIQRAFNPFSSTKPRGIGLGLSLARGMARSLGGDIRVQSAPGKGSTFTLEIPLSEESDEEA